MMKINRVWAMPNKYTFAIHPIYNLLRKYVKDGIGWVDPFAGNSSIALITNDIDRNTKATYHLHALEFVKEIKGPFEGVLLDPVYSLRQMKECYNNIGREVSDDDTKYFPGNVKDVIANKIKPGGFAICFGWNSSGFGKKRGYKLIEILIVCHGGNHNDTIVTVEQKINQVLS